MLIFLDTRPSLKKFLIVFLCIIMMFFLLNCEFFIPKAHAEAITFSVAAFSVLLSILIGLGCTMIYSFSTETLYPMIQGLFNKSGLSEKDLELVEEEGKTYVSKSSVDSVANAANTLGFFTPDGQKVEYINTTDFGLIPIFKDDFISTLNFRYFFIDNQYFDFYTFGNTYNGNPLTLKNRELVDIYLLSRSNSVFFTNSNNALVSVPVGTKLRIRQVLTSYGSSDAGMLISPYFAIDEGNGFSSIGVMFSYSVSFNSKIDALQYLTRSYWNKLQMAMITVEGDISGDWRVISIPTNPDVFFGGIAPAAEGTLPDVVDGKVTDLPKTWSEPKVISGNPSLPLTVPSTAEGVGSMTQSDAQAGTKSGTATENPPANPDKDFENNKNKFSIPVLLTKKFPFCVPFDIYNGLVLLNAPAVAPVFKVPFKFNYRNASVDEDILISFEQFEEPIRLLRWGLLLIFILSLAVGTKKIIWG